MRRGLAAASALAAVALVVLGRARFCRYAEVADGRPVTFGIRCSFNPCVVSGTIQYFLSIPVKNSSSTAFKVGTGTGTLKFTTSVSGPISIRVPIRITQRD